MKSTTMLLPRRYPIPNQDNNRIITGKYQNFPPHLAKILPIFKSLVNEAYDPNSIEDDHNDSTYDSGSGKED